MQKSAMNNVCSMYIVQVVATCKILTPQRQKNQRFKKKITAQDPSSFWMVYSAKKKCQKFSKLILACKAFNAASPKLRFFFCS